MSERRMKAVESAEPHRERLAPVDRPPLQEDEEPTLGEYMAVLVGARWLILCAVLLTVAAAGAYLWIAVPQYRSDILVQVEEKEQGFGIEGLSDMFSGKVPAETEMEIIRSRSLLGAVVNELSLDVSAQPRTLPVVGEALVRRHGARDLRSPVLSLGRYAWGGERIAVTRLAVTDSFMGRPLTLVARDGGRFSLRGPEGEAILDGQVGKAVEEHGVALFVSELKARPGTEFLVLRRPREAAVQDLQGAIRISEKGKKTGILQVSLDGPDGRSIAAILDAISRSYLRQNVERKSAEAQKTLEFLETQLPQLKDNLEKAEAQFEAYRSTKGSVDVSLETQALLARSVELEKALSELEVQRSELKQRFTESHPLLTTLNDKMDQFSRERSSIEQRFKKLPQAEMDSARLIRDTKVANELYVLLLNKAQELRVVKSGTVGNVRILDSAIVPLKPVSPKKAKTLALSIVLGFALGVGFAFVRRALNHGVEDPEAIERETGLAIYASVPRSTAEARLSRERDFDRVLAVVEPDDPAVESFRSLRTSLQFALVEAPNRIISVVGPAPSIGKSFASANLAAVLAEAGSRVLVVDADLRKGRLHGYFGGGRENGLSELISGSGQVESAIRTTVSPNIDFIACGRPPPNAATLLNSERFGSLLKTLAARYDFVVIDTAPVLAVTDAVLVARHSGVNLMVLRSGKHPIREITTALRRFEQGRVEIHGAVLNDVQVRRGYGNYGGYHYQYAYGTKRKSS